MNALQVLPLSQLQSEPLNVQQKRLEWTFVLKFYRLLSHRFALIPSLCAIQSFCPERPEHPEHPALCHRLPAERGCSGKQKQNLIPACVYAIHFTCRSARTLPRLWPRFIVCQRGRRGRSICGAFVFPLQRRKLGGVFSLEKQRAFLYVCKNDSES